MKLSISDGAHELVNVMMKKKGYRLILIMIN